MEKKNHSQNDTDAKLFSYQIEQVLNSSVTTESDPAGDVSFISNSENEIYNRVFLIAPRKDPFADLGPPLPPPLYRSSSKTSADTAHLTIDDSIFRVTDLRPGPNHKNIIRESRKNKCNCM